MCASRLCSPLNICCGFVMLIFFINIYQICAYVVYFIIANAFISVLLLHVLSPREQSNRL